MLRSRRRYWTWLVTAGAGLVLAAAVASGLFQLAVQSVPGYRADIERYVSEIAGRPVRIAGLGLTWRYYYPSLDLVGVSLLSADGTTVLLGAERLRLGFALTRLVRGDVMPNRLELQGIALDLRLGRDGRVRVAGMDEELGAAGNEPTEALRTLAEFAELRLERCRLILRDERQSRPAPLTFEIASARWSRGLLGTELDAELALPEAYGETALLRASLDGQPLEPSTWNGRWEAELRGLVAGPWLRPYLARGASVELTGAEARVSGELEAGRLRAADVQLRVDEVRARRVPHAVDVQGLEARLALTFAADGWRAQLRALELLGANGPWPSTSGELSYKVSPNQDPVFTAEAEFLRLGDIAPWLLFMRAPGRLEGLHDASGDIEDLQVLWQGEDEDARYSVRAKFDGLGLPATGRRVGIAGASGEFAADETGGRVVLAERPLTLELPGVLLTPRVSLEALDGELEWSRQKDGLRLGMPQFRWRLWGTQGEGRFDVLLPDQRGRSVELNLTAQFQADDAALAKPLMPTAWGRDLIDYLDRAVIAGRVPRGELVVAGPLDDFPFDKKPGTFSLDLEAEDVTFAFQPDWPVVEQVKALLRFRGNSLTIESTHGTIAGAAIQQVTARFADFGNPDLVIDGTVRGEAPQFYDFLARSPLREDFDALLLRTQAQGPAEVGIHLVIPVDHAQDTRVRGRVNLGGMELRHQSLPEPIRDIRGELTFKGSRVTAPQLTGVLYGMPLEATITARDEGSVLRTGFRLAIDREGRGASALVPAWLRDRLSGESAWRAELELGGGGSTPLTLSSDLHGTSVLLPPPLGKVATDRFPTQLTLGEAPDAPLRVRLEYHERLGADLRLRPVRDGWMLKGGTLRAGPGSEVAAPRDGLVLTGALSELNLGAWLDHLEGTGIEAQVQVLKHADVKIARAIWDNLVLADVRYRWTPREGGWGLQLEGAGAAGAMRWTDANKGALSGTLEHLVLGELAIPPITAAEEAAAAAAADREPVFDPNAFPRLDLDVGRLELRGGPLGHVRLVTTRLDDGQRLRTLTFEGDLLKGSASGEWRRRDGRSSANLNFDLTSTDAAAVLRAVGYAPNLDAKLARAQANLTWAGAPRGVDWQRAKGVVSLEFENGQLRAIDPGAGRVLGLINLFALPRRLTLNFRDVLSKGLGFDKIRGDFALADGNAQTENLVIDGPSLRMEVRGRIGLVARDYDQLVNVYPDVSSGITLGAALLGGPAVGALVLIAQELLDKPISQVTQLSYRVTGSWENPQVERIDEAPTVPRPPGPPGKP